jgi:hypothetical protein
MLLPPDPPKLDNPPYLDGRVLKARGYTWQIEMLGMWPADEGLFPNLDILCRLRAIEASAIHSVLVEVDRLFLHLPNPSGAIVQALEQKLDRQRLPYAVRVDVAMTMA